MGVDEMGSGQSGNKPFYFIFHPCFLLKQYGDKIRHLSTSYIP